jgi:hypothetical protein
MPIMALATAFGDVCGDHGDDVAARGEPEASLAFRADSPPTHLMIGDAIHHPHPVSLGPTWHTLYHLSNAPTHAIDLYGRLLDTLGCQHDDPHAGCCTPIYEPLTGITTCSSDSTYGSPDSPTERHSAAARAKVSKHGFGRRL